MMEKGKPEDQWSNLDMKKGNKWKIMFLVFDFFGLYTVLSRRGFLQSLKENGYNHSLVTSHSLSIIDNKGKQYSQVTTCNWNGQIFVR